MFLLQPDFTNVCTIGTSLEKPKLEYAIEQPIAFSEMTANRQWDQKKIDSQIQTVGVV